MCVLTEVTLAVQGGALPGPAFAPVRLDLGCLLRVLVGILEVPQRGIAGGAVGVQDVVRRVDFNGLRELFAGCS